MHKLLKNDVLFIEVSVNKADKYANRYAKVSNAYLIRNAKRIYIHESHGLRVEPFTGVNQMANDFFQEYFKASVKAGNGKTNAYVNNYDNIIVVEKYRDTTRTKF
jgi:hypothetical protein